jgi:hypothetical protein
MQWSLQSHDAGPPAYRAARLSNNDTADAGRCAVCIAAAAQPFGVSRWWGAKPEGGFDIKTPQL